MLGYRRTLQAEDLNRLDEKREAEYLSAALDNAWARRCQEAVDWNAKLDNGELQPGLLKRTRWAIQASVGGKGKDKSYGERRKALVKKWRDVGGRKAPSLAWSLNDTLGPPFWIGGVFKVVSDTRYESITSRVIRCSSGCYSPTYLSIQSTHGPTCNQSHYHL